MPRRNVVTNGEKPLRHDNGKIGRRTPLQSKRQAQVFVSKLEGRTLQAISIEFGVSKNTVLKDLKREYLRIEKETEDSRQYVLATQLARYELVVERGWERYHMASDALMQGGGQKIVDSSLRDITNALQRIDVLRGLEAPTRIEIGITSLLDALLPPDDDDQLQIEKNVTPTALIDDLQLK